MQVLVAALAAWLGKSAAVTVSGTEKELQVPPTQSSIGVPRSSETHAPPRNIIGPLAQAYCRYRNTLEPQAQA